MNLHSLIKFAWLIEEEDYMDVKGMILMNNHYDRIILQNSEISLFAQSKHYYYTEIIMTTFV